MSQQEKLNQLLGLSEKFLKILKSNKALLKKSPELKINAKKIKVLKKYTQKALVEGSKKQAETFLQSNIGDRPCFIDELIECIASGFNALNSAVDTFAKVTKSNIEDLVATQKDLDQAMRIAEIAHKLIEHIELEDHILTLEKEIEENGLNKVSATEYLKLYHKLKKDMGEGDFAEYIQRTKEGIAKAKKRTDNQLKKAADDPTTGRSNATYKDMSALPVYDKVDGINPDDPVQGPTMGNCFFISALSTLANSHTDLLKKNIKEKKDGIYEVTLYLRKNRNQKRKKTTIQVDADFPVDASGNLIFAGKGDNELWAMLFEKAYAKAMGGYDNIDGGGTLEVALEVLTGQETITKKETVDLGDGNPFTVTEDFINLKNDSETVIEENLSNTCDKNGIPTKAITLGTAPLLDSNIKLKSKDQLIAKHAYSLKKWDGIYLHLRNPHGQNDAKVTIPELKKHFIEVTVL
ncbi:MAG: hypothetical protein GY810_18205 [Aureispira sp.]|nr:hypothetical protein [Aureispira sp.]